MDKTEFNDKISVLLTREDGSRETFEQDKIKMTGLVTARLYDKNGKFKAERIVKNVVVNEGKNLNLDVAFGATAKPSWFMALIDTTGVNGSPAVTDTMLNHSNWNENTNYASATRPAWTPGAAASQSVTNATAISFAINATATIKGAFITSNSTKGGTTGTLWSAAEFSSLPVVNGDTLRLTYSLTIN